jgi:hypothetical protein
MLLKLGAVLLVVWLVGLVFFVDLGDVRHLPLLLGLMLVFLGFLKARDAAMAAARESNEPTRKP